MRYQIDIEKVDDQGRFVYKIMDTSTNTAMAVCWVTETASLVAEALNHLDIHRKH